MVTVNIVGKLNSTTGIGRHAVAWINALHDIDGLKLRFVDTRPAESETSLAQNLGVEILSVEAARNDPGDISIFTDVLWNGPSDLNYQKVPICKVKYCYSVFDSTLIPNEWVDIINNHFNGVIVPSKHLIEIYKNSGVKRPIFHIPLSLDLDILLDLPEKKNTKNSEEPFTFGTVAAYDRRKNVKALIDAFVGVFGIDNNNFKLKLQLTYNIENDDEYRDFIKKYRGTNIEITTNKLSEKNYISFMQSLDCFVNISLGEGYSIPVREAIALGKPAIITNIFAHKALEDVDSILKINCQMPVPAKYPQINGGYFGVQYAPFATDIRDALFRMHANYADYKKAASKNRKLANQWTEKQLKALYKSMVMPSVMNIRPEDVVTDKHLFVQSEEIYDQYYNIFGAEVCVSKVNIEKNKSNKSPKFVIMANDGGFFSVYNRYVSYLVWEKEANPEAIVLPDWHVQSLHDYYGLAKFTSFCYGKYEDKNIWLKLFEPLPFEKNEAAYNDVEKLHKGAVLIDDYNEKREPNLTYIHAYKLYKDKEFARWRRWYHKTVVENVIPRPHILKEIDDVIKKTKGAPLIGVHVRHPSHAIEQPGQADLHTEKFIKSVRDYMNTLPSKGKDHHIMLATDQEKVINQFVKEFGNRIHYNKNVKRTTVEHDDAFEKLDTNEKMKEGHQIQHLTAADPASWSTRMAEEVIIDAYLLSKCEALLHITSNISTAVSYLNPDLEMIYVS